jgi:hypothetical protein
VVEYVGNIADNTEGLFRIAVPQREVTVSATGEPAVLHMEVMNTSAIVDGYAVERASAPQWLEVESSQVRVIPGGEEALPVIMRVVSPTLVPAQQILIPKGQCVSTSNLRSSIWGQQHRDRFG